MAWSTFGMKRLIVCILLTGAVNGTQNGKPCFSTSPSSLTRIADTPNGTSTYKLAIGTGRSSSSSSLTSSIESSSPVLNLTNPHSESSPGSTVSTTSSSSASSTSSGSAELARSNSSAPASSSAFTEDSLQGVSRTKVSSELLPTASNGTTTSKTGLVHGTIGASIAHANITNATVTSTPNATITTAPRSNFTTSLPVGIGILGNSTFYSSCAYSDTACYSTCSANFDSCSYSWGQYSALYRTWLNSVESQGLVSVSATSSTTISYIYTLTSYLAVSLESTRNIRHSRADMQ